MNQDGEFVEIQVEPETLRTRDKSPKRLRRKSMPKEVMEPSGDDLLINYLQCFQANVLLDPLDIAMLSLTCKKMNHFIHTSFDTFGMLMANISNQDGKITLSVFLMFAYILNVYELITGNQYCQLIEETQDIETSGGLALFYYRYYALQELLPFEQRGIIYRIMFRLQKGLPEARLKPRIHWTARPALTLDDLNPLVTDCVNYFGAKPETLYHYEYHGRICSNSLILPKSHIWLCHQPNIPMGLKRILISAYNTDAQQSNVLTRLCLAIEQNLDIPLIRQLFTNTAKFSLPQFQLDTRISIDLKGHSFRDLEQLFGLLQRPDVPHTKDDFLQWLLINPTFSLKHIDELIDVFIQPDCSFEPSVYFWQECRPDESQSKALIYKYPEQIKFHLGSIYHRPFLVSIFYHFSKDFSFSLLNLLRQFRRFDTLYLKNISKVVKLHPQLWSEMFARITCDYFSYHTEFSLDQIR